MAIEWCTVYTVHAALSFYNWVWVSGDRKPSSQLEREAWPSRYLCITTTWYEGNDMMRIVNGIIRFARHQIYIYMLYISMMVVAINMTVIIIIAVIIVIRLAFSHNMFSDRASQYNVRATSTAGINWKPKRKKRRKKNLAQMTAI